MAEQILLAIPHDWGYGRAVLRSLYRWAKPRRSWVFDNAKKRGEWRGGRYRAVVALEDAERLRAWAARHGLPFCDLTGSSPDAARMVVDPVAIAGLALDQGRRRGYRQLAACDFRSGPQATGRLTAFVALCADAGLDCSVYEHAAWAGRGQRSLAGYWRRLHAWLAGLPKPAFVFAASDETGNVICECCRRTGIRVPEEVAVLGADNDDLYTLQSFPALSSIVMPTERIGVLVAQWLDAVCAGRDERPDHRLPPIRVVERRSTAALAIDDPVVHRAMELISDRAADGLGVPGLLRALGVGRRQLEQRFRASLGSSPHAEIRRRRVERVRELLDLSDHDLETIAEVTGFGSASRLSVVFKQLTGTTPGAWRRSIGAHLNH